MDGSPLPLFFKISQAAAYVGVSESSYRKFVREGVMPRRCSHPVTGKKTCFYSRAAIDIAAKRLAGIKDEASINPVQAWKAARDGSRT
jgi:hypothetical protein